MQLGTYLIIYPSKTRSVPSFVSLTWSFGLDSYRKVLHNRPWSMKTLSLLIKDFFYETRNYFGLDLLTGRNFIRICLEKYNFKSLKYKASTFS